MSTWRRMRRRITTRQPGSQPEPASVSQSQPRSQQQPASQPASQCPASVQPASPPASQPARQAAANSQQPLDSLRGPGNQRLCKGPSRPARQQPTASRWLQGPRGPEAAREAQPASQAAANSQQPADGLRCPGDQRLRGGARKITRCTPTSLQGVGVAVAAAVSTCWRLW